MCTYEEKLVVCVVKYTSAMKQQMADHNTGYRR